MSRRRAWLLALCVAGAPATSGAQGLRERAFDWARGDFRAPLVCMVDGASRQALRHVRIGSPPRGALPSLRLTFLDLQAPPGTQCSGVASPSEPNVIGTLELVFEGRNQPDTGEVDFRNAMRRDRGFAFRIRSGRLRVGPSSEPLDARAERDYAGGSARLRAPLRGSDEERRLASFAPRRILRLELEADDAPALGFDLIELPAP